MKINPWETPEGKKIWKSKASYFTWLRGNLRKIWSDYPIRKVWKQDKLRSLTEKERCEKKFHVSTKKVGQCVFCKEWMPGSKLECDHIESSDGCYDFETAEKFLWYCASQNGDNFQLTCKPCHKIKSYADKHKLSFQDAYIEKKTIEVMKGKEKEWLEDQGVIPASNAKLRREQVRQVLRDSQLEGIPDE